MPKMQELQEEDIEVSFVVCSVLSLQQSDDFPLMAFKF